MSQHDLAGLEAQMQKVLPLEAVLVQLDAYRREHGPSLTPGQKEGLMQTIRSLCLVLESLHNS